jgi:hypothetical protein
LKFDHKTEQSIMTTSRFIAALGLTVVLAPAALAETPVILNVKIQISNLLPEIGSIMVGCTIKEGLMHILSGNRSAALVNGGFVGTLAVGLDFVADVRPACGPGQQYACLNSYHTMSDLTPMSSYECSLTTVQTDGTNWWEGGMKESDYGPPWLKAKPGTPHVSVISGPFPPPK